MPKLKSFDKKFGEAFLAALPPGPGIYRVYDESGALIYVGKAKNLRRRLTQYRNAKRRKKHLKMRSIVSGAARIEVESCATEAEALLLENSLIREHRPRWNVAGAFYFLYPMLGVRFDQGIAYLCYTTRPELYSADFSLHGAFRSRDVTRHAFHALVELLSYIGHPIPFKKLAVFRRDRFSRVAAFRQLPIEWIDRLQVFFRGESKGAMEELVLALIENAGARKKSHEVQAALALLNRFWRHEAVPLRKALEIRLGDASYPVPQADRDPLFIRARF